MDIIVSLGIFFLGISVGSFLNTVVFRLGSSESALWGRSHCQSCTHSLEWQELVPVISFLMLGGKCRACHAPISFQYPIVELLTGIVFVFVFTTYRSSMFIRSPFGAMAYSSPDIAPLAYIGGLAFYLLVVALLLAIGIYDFRTSLIAPLLMFPLFLISLFGLLISWLWGISAGVITTTLLASLGAFGLFFGLWFFSKGRAMGFGDAQLASTIVLFLGAAGGIVALLLSFWTGALYGVLLMLLRRAGPKTEIPFGPFLALGALVSLLWGEALWQGLLYF